MAGNARPVSTEQVSQWNPDVIILASSAFVGNDTGAQTLQKLTDDPFWSRMAAVRYHEAYINPTGGWHWDRCGIEGRGQMVLIARTLAQEPALLVMDEPTSNLDLGNKTRVLHRIRMLADAGLAIVMISHAPDHAFAVASTAALLRPDGTLRVGAPEDVLDEPGLTHAYGEDVMVVRATAPDGTIVRSCVPMM